jgi:hypothetical protein
MTEAGETYLREHNIDDALKLMRDHLLEMRPEDPWTFMIESMFFFVNVSAIATKILTKYTPRSAYKNKAKWGDGGTSNEE